MPIYHKVRNNIQEFRQVKYTQEEFSKLMGVTRVTVSLWERNKIQPASEKWGVIAELLDQPETNIFYLQV
jgi:DNA-binding XRE family transcriptional regulator